MESKPVCRKISAFIPRGDRILTITASQHPEVYCLPGGPAVEGETHEETLARELVAELGVGPAWCSFLGKFRAVSGIDGALVVTHLYRVILAADPRAVQPGRALRWLNLSDGAQVSTSVRSALRHGPDLLEAAERPPRVPPHERMRDRPLSWYIRPHPGPPPPEDPREWRDEDLVSMEEIVALRRRTTGADRYLVADSDLVDPDELERCYRILAAQTLRRGDWAYAYMDALSRNRGDRAAADEEMRRAWGRTVSPSYAVRLHARWVVKEAAREAEARRVMREYGALDEGPDEGPDEGLDVA